MRHEDLKKEKSKVVEIDRSLDQFTGRVASKEKIERAKEKISKLEDVVPAKKNQHKS